MINWQPYEALFILHCASFLRQFVSYLRPPKLWLSCRLGPAYAIGPTHPLMACLCDAAVVCASGDAWKMHRGAHRLREFVLNVISKT